MGIFESPVYLFLFLIVPPMIYLVHFHRNRGGKLPFSFRIWDGQGFRPRFSLGKLIYIASRALFWIGFCCLIFAAAGPVTIEKEKAFLSRGIDIFIVLDESPSMLAQDMGPVHRFDTAKSVIRDFVTGRENDPVGLVSFSEEAVLRIPTTLDYDSLLGVLAALGVSGLTDGTAIGMGVSLAASHLRFSDAPGKVMILLTDGENNAGEVEPEEAAELARELEIRIYTIGIGKEGEAYMELQDPETGKVIKGRYRGRFDEALLRQIAAVSGGRYYHARSPGTLSAIFREIDSLEKSERRALVTVKKETHHRRFIALGLGLVLGGFFLRKALIREIF